MSYKYTGGRPRLRRAVAGTSVLLGLLLASACSDDGGNQGNPSQTPQFQTSQSPAPQSPSGQTEGPSDTGTPDPGQAPSVTPGEDSGDLGAPVATRTAAVHEGTMKLEVFQPRRRDNAMYLTVRLTAVGQKARIWYALSDQDRQAGDSENFAPDGFQLVDGVHKKVYLVAHDGNGHCFCSPRDLGQDAKEPGSPVLVSATFAAPPQDVTKINIQVPSFGTFLDVPLG